jgi:UDP-3-O-[3-hydroxymyristoyl] glucosamine N-acyltransferase
MKLPIPMTLTQIASVIGGRVQGPGDLTVSSIATSPLHATESDIVLAFDKDFLKQVDRCRAAALVVPEGFKSERPLILVERPNLAIYKVLTALQPKRYFPEAGVHPTAVVDASCELGDRVAIGPYVTVGPKTKIGNGTKIMSHVTIGGEVVIGEDCLIHPGCMIADYVIIGNRVIMQQGAALGSDGFGYVSERPSNMELRLAGVKELSFEPNPLLKIPQIGTVIIEDDVEIGANTTIDRATIGATKIGKGTKIDNLVMVAHNCTIGKETILVAQVGVAGSCSIGDRAILAGQVGVKDHITIGRDAILEGQAGVMKDVADEDVQVGAPAIPVRDFMTHVAHTKKLPKLFAEFKALQKRVAELEKELERAGGGALVHGSKS